MRAELSQMTVDAVPVTSRPEAGHAAPPAARPPYPKSWVDHLEDVVARWPIPNWSFYALVFALGYAVATVLRLQSGVPLALSRQMLPPVFLIWIVYLLALTHHLDDIAVERLRRFRPALALSDAEFDELSYRLTTMPAVPTVVHGLAWVGVASVLVVRGWDTLLRLGYPPWEMVLTTLTYFVGGAIMYHSLRQLRIVTDLYNRVTNINLHNLEPLHAFPALTARTSLGWLALLVVTFELLPREVVVEGGFGVTWAVSILLAIAAFVVPLMGMHGQLDTAKHRALAEAGERLRGLMDEIHERIDKRQLEDIDGLNRAAAAVLAEQERVTKMSTWPWSAGTLRGFVTALLLPLLIKLGQELISQVVGLGG
jgi:hypothetical protein